MNALGIFDCSSSLLRHIDRMHPNIVNLKLVANNALESDTEVHMKHIEGLAFLFIEYSKEVQWNCNHYSAFVLINFIQKHKNTIQTLIVHNTIFSDEHLVQFNNLP